MNLFCSITSRKSITTVIIFILNVSYSYQSCVSLFDSCEYDCDCCGNDINKGIRCELRNQGSGKRCYESQFVGQSCNISSQCNSQNCVNNICQPLLRSRPANPIPFCPLVGDSSYITAPVDGLLPTCACPKGPTQVQDASYAMDDNLSTDYVNYNSLTYSGFIAETTSNAPLRKIVLCTSNANPENDPMCFRLEGKCEHDDNFTLLQEGMIPFARDLRQSCTTIAVERGRQSCSQYKILFGCRRGGYDDSCQRDSRFHKFRRQIRNRKLDTVCTGDYPVILSEVRLLGKCNEGSLFTPPTAPTTPTEAPTSSPPTSPPTRPPTQALTSSPTSPPPKEPCTATFIDNEGKKYTTNVDRLVVDENTYVFGVLGFRGDWYKMVAIDKSGTFIQCRYMKTNKELTVANWNSANVQAVDYYYSVSDVTFCAKETRPPTRPPTSPPTSPPTRPPTSPPTSPPTRPPTQAPSPTSPPPKEPCTATFIDNEGVKYTTNVDRLVVDENTYVFGVLAYRGDWYKMVAIDKSGTFIQCRYMGVDSELTIANWNSANVQAVDYYYSVSDVTFCDKE